MDRRISKRKNKGQNKSKDPWSPKRQRASSDSDSSRIEDTKNTETEQTGSTKTRKDEGTETKQTSVNDAEGKTETSPTLNAFYDNRDWLFTRYVFLTFGDRKAVWTAMKKSAKGKPLPHLKHGLLEFEKTKYDPNRVLPSYFRDFFSVAQGVSTIDPTVVLAWSHGTGSFVSTDDIFDSSEKGFVRPGESYQTAQTGFHIVRLPDDNTIASVLICLKKGTSEGMLAAAFLKHASDVVLNSRRDEDKLDRFLSSFTFTGTSRHAATALGKMFRVKEVTKVVPSVLVDETYETSAVCTWKELLDAVFV